MKNRFYKFLVMLFTVIAVGSGATMLNLRMQEKATGENDSFRPYAMLDQAQLTEETVATATQAREQAEIGASFPLQEPVSSEKSMIPVGESETLAVGTLGESDDQESDHEILEEPVQQASGNEKQVYYARLQDMERVYDVRMNAAAKEALAVQQTTTSELLEIWDDELNAIYQKLRKSLSEDDFRSLRNEERAWIRSRDAAANQAASQENYSNSAKNLAHTRSLLQWTKERVYELAAMYYGE